MSLPSPMTAPAPGAAWRTPQAVYLPMRDGVRLAVDVWLPPGLPAGARVPAIVQFTRYWRAFRWNDGAEPRKPPAAMLEAGPAAFSEVRAFLARGHACVVVDARGSGASFGHRISEYSDDEVRDQREVIGWVAAQAWCSGRVGATGVSYSGNAAELAQVDAHPALRAVAPRFTDYDWYEFILFPGGLRNIAFGPDWGQFITALDAGQPVLAQPSPGAVMPLGVLPVDADADGTLLAWALAAHAANHRFDGIALMECRDDRPAGTSAAASANLAELGVALRAGAHPAQHWLSWLDSGTAAGGLARWRTLDVPMQLIIGTWNHGAAMDGDPFLDDDTRSVDPRPLFETLAGFFDEHLGSDEARTPVRCIRYKTMNAPAGREWRETRAWPPAGVALQRWYAAAGGQLLPTPPAIACDHGGVDHRAVDFAHGTGHQTRWTTSMGGPVHYADRAEADGRLLTYTSLPLAEDLWVTGEALVTLHLASTQEDGAFIVYLEHVAPDGRVRYLTEGQLRAVHRGRPHGVVPYVQAGPPRSFRRADLQPMVPGQVTEIVFALLPTSVLFRAGDRLRIALAGADVDSFARVPPQGDPVWTVHRCAAHPSFIDLPVQPSSWSPA